MHEPMERKGADYHDRDQRLLEHLAAIHQLAVRDSAIAWLANEVTSAIRASGIRAIAPDSAQPQSIAVHSPLQVESVSVPPMGLTPPEQHVGQANGLASHLSALLPMEYQATLGPILSSVTLSVRTLIMLVLMACLLGLYSGHVAVPAWLREQLQSCQPVKQP